MTNWLIEHMTDLDPATLTLYQTEQMGMLFLIWIAILISLFK